MNPAQGAAAALAEAQALTPSPERPITGPC
jgi:hypothetical protein